MFVLEDYLEFKKSPVYYFQKIGGDFSKLPDTPAGINSAVFINFAYRDSSFAYGYKGKNGEAVDNLFRTAGAQDPDNFRKWFTSQLEWGGDTTLDLLLKEISKQKLKDFFEREEVKPFLKNTDFVSNACFRYYFLDSCPGHQLGPLGREAIDFFKSVFFNPDYFIENTFKSNIREALDNYPQKENPTEPEKVTFINENNFVAEIEPIDDLEEISVEELLRD